MWTLLVSSFRWLIDRGRYSGLVWLEGSKKVVEGGRGGCCWW